MAGKAKFCYFLAKIKQKPPFIKGGIGSKLVGFLLFT